MPYTIYKLVNQSTGKTYTGVTKKLKIRTQLHFASLKRGKHNNPGLQADFNRGDKFSLIEVLTVNTLRDGLKEEVRNMDNDTYNIRINIATTTYSDGALKKEVLEKLDASYLAKGRLCTVANRGLITIEKWLHSNSIKLTTPAALKVIREQLGLTDAQILEESKQTA